MAENFANIESVFSQLGQARGAALPLGSTLPAAPGALPAAAESAGPGSFQARLNEILTAAGGTTGDSDALGLGNLPVSVLSTKQPASAPPTAAVTEALPAQSGKLLPLGGKLLPPAADAAALPPDFSATTPAGRQVAGATAAVVPPLPVATPVVPGPVPTGSAAPAGAATLSEVSETVPDAAAFRRSPLPDVNVERPPPEFLAQAQQRLEQGDAQTSVRPATLLALARSNAGASVRQESALSDAAMNEAMQTALAKRGDSRKLAALSELSPGALNVQARPADAPQPQLLPANVSAETPLSRSFAPLDTLRGQVGTPGWSAGLGQRLLTMAENGMESARLRLNPASLGPMDIQISVEDDRAQVWFGAQHGATREALEAALPRLREMFAEQGLELVQADVQDSGTNAGTRGEQFSPNGDRQPAQMTADVIADRADGLDAMAALASLTKTQVAARGLDIYV